MTDGRSDPLPKPDFGKILIFWLSSLLLLPLLFIAIVISILFPSIFTQIFLILVIGAMTNAFSGFLESAVKEGLPDSFRQIKPFLLIGAGLFFLANGLRFLLYPRGMNIMEEIFIGIGIGFLSKYTLEALILKPDKIIKENIVKNEK